MLTSGSKYFFGLAGFAYVAAVLYGAASGDHSGTMDMLAGPLSLGYKGGVGDHLGYSVLIGLAFVSFFLGCVTVAFRDADAEAVAELVDAESVPEVAAPATLSYLPIIAAFAGALLLLGLVIAAPLVAIGGVVLGLVIVMWAGTAWADRATGDPEVNRRIRNRVLYPIQVPVTAAVVIAAFVFALSRILLALESLPSAIVFGLIPTMIFVVCALIATRKSVSQNVVVGLLVAGGIVVLAGAVFAAAAGEREFEEHEEEHEAEEGALSPAPGAPVVVRTGR